MIHGYFEELHKTLQEQYALCDCPSCQSIQLSSNSDGKKPPRKKDLVTQGLIALKKLHQKGNYSVEDLFKTQEYKDLIQQTTDIFNSAISYQVSEDLKKQLQYGNLVFSGLKTHAQLTEARQFLRDENGNIRAYHLFERDILKLNKNYNKNYLEAEYEFAIQSAQSVEQWLEFSDDTEHYLLEYRTAGDEKVRADHDALRGICLPKNDPFWESFMPPLGWRCRCNVIEVLASNYQKSDSNKARQLAEHATTQIGKNGKNKLEMFRFNPALDKTLFPKNNAYAKVVAADKVKKQIKKEAEKIQEQDNDKAVFEFFGESIADYKKDIRFKEIMKNAKKHNLRDAELVCFFEYSMIFYQIANPYLRGLLSAEDKASYEKKGVRNVIDTLNKALDKLDSYKGTVYRGTDLQLKQIKAYEKALKTGKAIVKPEFLSTTMIPNKAFEGNVFYKIHSKNGKIIEELSSFQEEKEVLFKPNTKFKVVDVIIEDGKYNITMKEL